PTFKAHAKPKKCVLFSCPCSGTENSKSSALSIRLRARRRRPVRDASRVCSTLCRLSPPSGSSTPDNRVDGACSDPGDDHDRYGRLQRHEHLGGARKRYRIGRAERNAGRKSDEQVIRIARRPGIVVGQRAAALWKQECPCRILVRLILDAWRINNPVPDGKDENIG